MSFRECATLLQAEKTSVGVARSDGIVAKAKKTRDHRTGSIQLSRCPAADRLQLERHRKRSTYRDAATLNVLSVIWNDGGDAVVVLQVEIRESIGS
jgi:hypothetical protein